MASVSARRVAELASSLLELPISVERAASGQIVLRVVGLQRPHGFSVSVHSGLSFVYAELQWDSLSGPLLELVRSAPDSAWDQLGATIESLRRVNTTVDLDVDGARLADRELDHLRDLRVNARSVAWREELSWSLAEVGAVVVGIVISLLPIDRGRDEPDASLGEYDEEGNVRRALIRRYERSRSNRAIAIMTHGRACTACGFDFSATYGEWARDYVEIHHLEPVHLMDAPRVVNPVEELVPLCANCHRMVHRADPPISPSELKAKMESAKGPSGA